MYSIDISPKFTPYRITIEPSTEIPLEAGRVNPDLTPGGDLFHLSSIIRLSKEERKPKLVRKGT